MFVVFFIVVLLLTLSAAYGYEKTAQSCAEVAIACFATAVLCAALTLITAPWPVHLGMLLVLLYKTAALKLPAGQNGNKI